MRFHECDWMHLWNGDFAGSLKTGPIHPDGSWKTAAAVPMSGLPQYYRKLGVCSAAAGGLLALALAAAGGLLAVTVGDRWVTGGGAVHGPSRA